MSGETVPLSETTAIILERLGIPKPWPRKGHKMAEKWLVQRLRSGEIKATGIHGQGGVIYSIRVPLSDIFDCIKADQEALANRGEK